MSGTRVAEVGDGIFQLTTHIEDIDFGVNQYLVLGEEPLLFHAGMRWLFPQLADAVAGVVPVEMLRWVAFGHVESDECGAMNHWLAAAPRSTVVQGQIGCMVSIGDLADREPRPLAHGEVLDIAGHRLRWLDTPHVPHAWEAGLLYDETTRTLFCGDLFSQGGPYAPTTASDIVEPTVADGDAMRSLSLSPTSGRVVRELAALDVDTLALMHGPAFTGDCRQALLALADDFDRRVAAVAVADS
jgi:flavorubredoxin